MGHEKVQAFLDDFVLDLTPVAKQKGDDAIRHVLALKFRGYPDAICAVLYAGGCWTVLPTMRSEHENPEVTVREVLAGKRWCAMYDPLDLGVRLFEEAGEITAEDAATWRRWHEDRRQREITEQWLRDVREGAARRGFVVMIERKGEQ